MPANDFTSLFEFLPIGAYRSSADGQQLRANPALVRLNGFATEAEQLAVARDIGAQWYVDPQRRGDFKRLLERNGSVVAFESEVWRLHTRERIWISENAHVVRAADGAVLFYEGTVEEITGRVRDREALRASQDDLNQIMALLPGMVYRLVQAPDGTRRISYASPGTQALLGITPEALMADISLMLRMRHPDDVARNDSEARAALLAKAPLHAELRMVMPDGQQRWLQVISGPAPAAPGALGSRVGVMLDITDRKRAEQALLDNSELWKRALESSGDGVWDWDVQRGVQTLSPAGLALYGYPPSDLPATPQALDGLVHPDDLPRMLQARADHFAGLTPAYVCEKRMRCHNGQYMWVLSRGIVISRDADGVPLRMVGTHTDMTAEKQAETLRRERDTAAAADRAKSEFLSRVSHEFRTPLNAILGFAQLMELDPGASERQLGWIRHVLASGQHLLGLMDDILDLSSAQTGQMPVSSETLLLRPVLNEVFAMLAGTAQQAGVALIDDMRSAADGAVDAAATMAVRADRKRLKQIVGNLLSNAIKYNRPGGWVRVSLQALALNGGMVELAVADSGKGIAADELARLFKPFERLGAQGGPVTGTGLGLALSRQLAEAMSGSIGVTSEPGQGSVFRLKVPSA